MYGIYLMQNKSQRPCFSKAFVYFSTFFFENAKSVSIKVYLMANDVMSEFLFFGRNIPIKHHVSFN